MAQQPLTVTVDEFTSWFDDTRYAIRQMQDDMMKDPIWELLGEDTSSNRSSIISTTGIDYSGYAKAKTPGGMIVRDAPVEADQHSVYYVTFVQPFYYEHEAILHDEYRLQDPNGTKCIERLWKAVGLFLTNCVWNYNTASTFEVPAQNGTITYTITTPDGQPIVSASHSGPNYSGKTNIGGTAAFSGPAVVANLDVGYQNATSPAGYPWDYRPNAFLFGRNAALREAIAQYTHSTQVYSSNNNAVTVTRDGTFAMVEFQHAPKNNVGAFDTTASKLHKWASADLDLFKQAFQYKWIDRPHIVEGPTVDMDNLDTFRIATCRLAFKPESPWAMVQNNASTAPVSAY